MCCVSGEFLTAMEAKFIKSFLCVREVSANKKQFHCFDGKVMSALCFMMKDVFH